ncbi:hypothetical protein GTO89_00860 [Heliobacterium gestii]|uniref:YkgJ family cysteine cluster protein n=1 Tax=Heliomicrobium gestii TaxID=2699 RepID=A0A845L7L8_HELGE|nr:YkgJ family cysteine cluster protein [Heliomicrobium gestii]MBM7865320.1 Fe-S-cluster containining protein [Heliomicrobium gestii]MZP41581.1 hypothetical protein [Heliomicrobium gestii]
MERVVLERREFPDGLGYDVTACHPGATVADYLGAVDAFFERSIWTALRQGCNRTGWNACEGCPGCCRERIPLTVADAVRLALSLPDVAERAQSAGVVTAEDLLQAIEAFGHIHTRGRAVDITLRRTEDGWCGLFNHSTHRCHRHAFRPLVCRTYFCCPVSHRAEKLRQRLLNAGEDELVRRLLLSSKGAELTARGLRLSDYPPGPWSETAGLSLRFESEALLAPLLTGLNLAR